VDGRELSEADALAAADVLVLASEGIRLVPGVLLRALAAGIVPVASRLPAYEELLSDGRYGLAFEPLDVQTLAAHLARLIGEPESRAELRHTAESLRQRFGWSRVADDLTGIYDGLVARRHDARGDGQARRRLSSRS